MQCNVVPPAAAVKSSITVLSHEVLQLATGGKLVSRTLPLKCGICLGSARRFCLVSKILGYISKNLGKSGIIRRQISQQSK